MIDRFQTPPEPGSAWGEARSRRPWFLLALFVAVLLCGAAVPASAVLRGVVRIGRVMVPAQTESRGPLLVIGGPLVIEGKTDAPVIVVGGRLTLDGHAGDDVIALFGTARLGSVATASGNLVALGGDISLDPDATVSGSVIGNRIPWPAPLQGGHESVGSLVIERLRLAGLATAALLLLGLAVWTVLPWPALVTTATARRSRLRSAVLGMGALLWAPLLIAPLAVSLAGLPLAVLLLFALSALWMIGIVSSAVRLGHRVLSMGHQPPSMLTSTLAGLILLGLLPALPVIGPVVLVLAGCVGLGAALLALWDREAANELSVTQTLAALKLPE